jgi:parallel beta-helix repeat protein
MCPITTLPETQSYFCNFLSQRKQISGNNVNSNTGHGILLENAGSNNNLSRNTISSNGGDGFTL